MRRRRAEAGAGSDERGRVVALGRGGALARVGDDPSQSGSGGGQGRAEIDLVVLDAAPPGEVAVEGAQALASRRGYVPDAGAGAAGRLGHRGAGGEEIRQQPLAGHDLEDAARAGEDYEGNRQRHALTADRPGHGPPGPPATAGAPADQDWLARRAFDLA